MSTRPAVILAASLGRGMRASVRAGGIEEGQVAEVVPEVSPVAREKAIRLLLGVCADQEIGHDPAASRPSAVACRGLRSEVAA